MEWLAKLSGSRTYILAFATALLGVWMTADDLGNAIGLWDLPDVSTGVLALLGGSTVATIRAGIANK